MESDGPDRLVRLQITLRPVLPARSYLRPGIRGKRQPPTGRDKDRTYDRPMIRAFRTPRAAIPPGTQKARIRNLKNRLFPLSLHQAKMFSL